MNEPDRADVVKTIEHRRAHIAENVTAVRDSVAPTHHGSQQLDLLSSSSMNIMHKGLPGNVYKMQVI